MNITTPKKSLVAARFPSSAIPGLQQVVARFETEGASVFPYPSHSIACAIAERVGGLCRPKHVKSYIVETRNWRRVQLQQSAASGYHYFLLNKPRGFSSMRDPTGFKGRHPSCYDLLPSNWPHVPHVGRLDVDTEGLLLFTDDGKLVAGLIGGDVPRPGQSQSGNANQASKPLQLETACEMRQQPPRVPKTYLVEVVVLPPLAREAFARRAAVRAASHQQCNCGAGYCHVELTAKIAAEVASAEYPFPAREQTRDGPPGTKKARMTGQDIPDQQESEKLAARLPSAFLRSMTLPFEYSDGSLTRPADEVIECTQEMLDPKGNLQYLVLQSTHRHQNCENGKAMKSENSQPKAAGSTCMAKPVLKQGVPIKKLNRRLRKLAAKQLKRQNIGTSSGLSSGCTPHVQVQSHWLKVRLSQGKNRQIRRLCARAQLEVLRLVRVAVGPITLLPSTVSVEAQAADAPPFTIRPGTVRSLTETELKACYKLALPGQECPALLPLPPPSLPASSEE
eukprot:INCI3865.1.p1 GENE.INCI3865.1~~INCI3865.1.p1  ORF type:complete len:508 (+),score=73.61 INCI3865.1:148-1671(+)